MKKELTLFEELMQDEDLKPYLRAFQDTYTSSLTCTAFRDQRMTSLYAVLIILENRKNKRVKRIKQVFDSLTKDYKNLPPKTFWGSI